MIREKELAAVTVMLKEAAADGRKESAREKSTECDGSVPQ